MTTTPTAPVDEDAFERAWCWAAGFIGDSERGRLHLFVKRYESAKAKPVVFKGEINTAEWNREWARRKRWDAECDAREAITQPGAGEDVG
jgi:hypothetical protein